MKLHIVTFPLCLLALNACQKKDEQAAGGERPPSMVRYVNPVQEEIIAWDEYTGRIEAVEQVEVRSRVGGMLEKIHFTDGQMVNEGDLLFTIDRKPFEAQLAAAQGDLGEAIANRDLAKANAERGQALLDRNAISQEDVDNRRGSFMSAEAKVQAEQARVDSAELDLSYTEVRAPITGRISDRFVTEGNLIAGGSSQSTLLTTIVSVDPIYCRIDADEASVLKYMRMTQEGSVTPQRQGEMIAEMGLSDDEGFPRKGKINFVDNRLDTATATLRTRAIFDNKDGFLTPGMFAKVRLPGRGKFTAILVPEVAIQTQQDHASLLTVGPDDKVVITPVEIGAIHGNMRVIESELPLDTRVIVSGLTMIFPGAQVQPEKAEEEQIPEPKMQSQKTPNEDADEKKTATDQNELSAESAELSQN